MKTIKVYKKGLPVLDYIGSIHCEQVLLDKKIPEHRICITNDEVIATLWLNECDIIITLGEK